MHELGLVYQIIKTVDDVKLENGIDVIDTVVLNVGEMSDVVPQYIEQAWNIARESTTYTNAKLKLNIIPAVAMCKNCGHTDNIKNLGLECPKCKSADFKIVSGREFDIDSIITK